MATGAALVILQCVLNGSISLNDMEIKRRPYHRNCTCALHKLNGVCSNGCSQQRNMALPKRKEWRDCSLMRTSKFSSISAVNAASVQDLESLCLESATRTTDGN